MRARAWIAVAAAGPHHRPKEKAGLKQTSLYHTITRPEMVCDKYNYSTGITKTVSVSVCIFKKG